MSCSRLSGSGSGGRAHDHLDDPVAASFTYPRRQRTATVDDGEHVPASHLVARARGELHDGPSDGSRDGVLHLHRLEGGDGVAGIDRLTGGDVDSEDRARHRRGDLDRPSALLRAGGGPGRPIHVRRGREAERNAATGDVDVRDAVRDDDRRFRCPIWLGDDRDRARDTLCRDTDPGRPFTRQPPSTPGASDGAAAAGMVGERDGSVQSRGARCGERVMAYGPSVPQ